MSTGRRRATLQIPIDGSLPRAKTIAASVRTVDGCIVELKRRWPQLVQTVDDWSRGYPASSSVTTSVGGAHHGAAGDPVGENVVQLVDRGRLRDDSARLREELLLAEGLMASLIQCYGRIFRLVPGDGTTTLREKVLPAGAGTCGACGRWCEGGKDRLRSGWCDSCRKAWERLQERIVALTGAYEVAEAAVVALEVEAEAIGDVVPIELGRARRELDAAGIALAEARLLDDRARFAASRHDRAAGE